VQLVRVFNFLVGAIQLPHALKIAHFRDDQNDGTAVLKEANDSCALPQIERRLQAISMTGSEDCGRRLWVVSDVTHERWTVRSGGD